MAQNNWSGVPQSVRDKLRDFVFARDGQRCMIRGPKCTIVAEELDHVVPRWKGGAVADVDNLRPACRRCNRGRRYDAPSPQVMVPSKYSGLHVEGGEHCRCGEVGYPSRHW